MNAIQREGDVVHLVVQKVTDLSAELASVGSRKSVFSTPHGRGEQVRNGAGPDPRDLSPKGLPGMHFFDPHSHIDEIKVKSRDFR